MAEGNKAKGYHAPGRRICAVCGRVLDELSGDVLWFPGDRRPEGGLWFHGAASVDEPDVSDHPAIPIRDDEAPEGHIRPRCDFCFADDPAYVLPVRTFQDPSLPGANSLGDWAACGNCARHLQRNDWKGLLRRAVTGYEARHHEVLGPRVVESMQRMYRTLRKNVTGALYRLEDQ